MRRGIESILTHDVATLICEYFDVKDGINLSVASKNIQSAMSMNYYHSKVAVFVDWKQSVPDDLSKDPRLVIKVPDKNLSFTAMKKFVDDQLDEILVLVVEKGRPEDVASFVGSVFNKSCKVQEKLKKLALEFIEKKDVKAVRILANCLDGYFLESRLLSMLGVYGKWDQIEVVAKSISHIRLSLLDCIIKRAIYCGSIGLIRDLFKEFKDIMPADRSSAGNFLNAKLRESEMLARLIIQGDFQQVETSLRGGSVLLSYHMNNDVIESLSQSNNYELVELIITNSNTEQDYRGVVVYKLASGENYAMIQFLLSHNKTISARDIDIALSVAADQNKLEMVRFLLNFGELSVEVRSSLIEIAARVDNTQMVSLLVGEGKEISQKSRGQAISYASWQGNFEILNLMLDGAYELPQEQVIDLAVDAIRIGNIEIILRLFNSGYDIPQSVRGWVLVEAASRRNFNMVEALIGKYNQNQIDKDDRHSAMLYAIRFNDPAIFAIIFDRGGALSQEDCEELLSQAEGCDCHEIVAFLKKAS
ncbi:MAG: ankyrin repeat domain-containing protein [Chlamydiae bacterium]|nr:ankyrin repeat domain-containing protein [Chlamydiota bacterium]